MASIGIFGSCATRDAIEFVRGERTLAWYVARASLISTFSSPPAIEGVETFDFSIAGKAGFEERQLRNEVLKYNADILAQPVDVVIYDGIDERFSMYEGPGWTVTNSNYLAASQVGKLAKAVSTSVMSSPAHDRERWVAALTQFSVRSSRKRLIIHRALWADKYRTPDGEIRRFGDEDLAVVERENSKLNDIYDLMSELAPDSMSINPPEDLLFSDYAHKWGRDFFHYGPEYYQYVSGKIAEALDRVSG